MNTIYVRIKEVLFIWIEEIKIIELRVGASCSPWLPPLCSLPRLSLLLLALLDPCISSNSPLLASGCGAGTGCVDLGPFSVLALGNGVLLEEENAGMLASLIGIGRATCCCFCNRIFEMRYMDGDKRF